MTRGLAMPSWRRWVCGLVLLALIGGSTQPATAATAAGWWLATGLGAGAVSPDQDLANYRWDTGPTALYALQATVGRGRAALGLRFSRWATTQGTGLAQPTTDPQVQLSNFDLVGELRLVELAGFQLWASALAGRVAVSYTPDEVVIDTGGGAVTVAYKPITETNLGVGLALRRGFGRQWTASLAAERAGFHLDTSHRRGAEIVDERTLFANWSLRLQLAWVLDLG